MTENQRIRRVLVRARQIVRRGWCKGTAARNRCGESLNSGSDPGAVSCCLSSAIELAVRKLRAGEPESTGAHRIVREAIDRMKGHRKLSGTDLDAVVQYNDTRRRRKKDILNVLGKAIRRCAAKRRRKARR